ncbi:MAG TPA: non-homologous end-joining DNA ligase [Candidatus Thermoplasmatota archaeon]|nr:non-homologous end-joining DNA ligase [Candidatus Thermoplasmatota archaeon]
MAAPARERQADDPLGPYRAMREFRKTPEPAGARAKGRRADGRPAFVIQEHHARSLHWDLRLERDGVLVSWAVPKGIPLDKERNNLAVQTEDHPMQYRTFEGTIPEGQYGAGPVTIWDEGTYEPVAWEKDKVKFVLHGRRVSGRYVLFRTRGKNWMIHRMDPPAKPRADPMPERVVPMMAKLSGLPKDDPAWGYEIKWDGVRAVAFVQGGRVRLQSRNLLDVTAQYPEIAGLGPALGSREAVLDGEIVAFDEKGTPSFQRLQPRMGLQSEAAVRRMQRAVPVTYVLFDVLYLEGESLLARPYDKRRRILEALGLEGPHWQTPSYHRGDGAALLAATRAKGLEGIMAKRLDSPYEPGLRSGAWRKIKNAMRQEVVIGGFTRGEGARLGRIGALLVGVYEEGPGGEPRLRYAGKVGTGFTDAELDRLDGKLAPLVRSTSPFVGGPPRGAFVDPRLVAEVAFTEWTREGTLRQPSYKGLRFDKDPTQVVREG